MAGATGGVQAALNKRNQTPTMVQANTPQAVQQFGNPVVDGAGSAAQTIMKAVGQGAAGQAAAMNYNPINIQAAQIGSQGYNAAQAAAQTAGSRLTQGICGHPANPAS